MDHKKQASGHMIMKESDIWLTARLLIEVYGDDAEVEATLRYQRTAFDGNLNCFNVWKRVRTAVTTLRYRAAGPDIQTY